MHLMITKTNYKGKEKRFKSLRGFIPIRVQFRGKKEVMYHGEENYDSLYPSAHVEGNIDF